MRRRTIGGERPTSPCEVESAYYCIRVEHDQPTPSGRILWLDDLLHSYVDLDDPTYLEFDYIQSFADAVEVRVPRAPGARRAAHRRRRVHDAAVPRAPRIPGRKSTVLEIDPAVLEDRPGASSGSARRRDLQVHIGDGRIGIRDRPDDSADLVVGDAFGSLSVPWHLTTTGVRRGDRIACCDPTGSTCST